MTKEKINLTEIFYNKMQYSKYKFAKLEPENLLYLKIKLYC